MEKLDLAEVCRVCLTKHKDMYLASDVGVADKLLDCASVQLPPESLVCEFCKSEVNKWFSFKQQVLKSMEVANYIEDYHRRREKPIEEYLVKDEEEVEQVEIKQEIVELQDSLIQDQVYIVIKNEEDTPTETLPQIVYKCDICENIVSSLSAILHHQRLHTKHFKLKIPSPPPLEEEHSNSSSLSPQTELDDKKYQCDLCHKSFISKNGIMWHKQIHSALKLGLSKDAERFPCSYCPMIYEKKSSLVDHMKWKHNRSLKKPRFNFSNPKYDLKVNLRSYKIEKQKSYKCDGCKRSFTKLGNWAAHRRIHCKGSLFICNDCGRGFKRQRDLLNHQLKHVKEQQNESSISVEQH